MKAGLRKFLFSGLILIYGFSMNAQPNPPGSDNPAPIPGSIWLIGAAVALGLKSRRKIE